ncbi:AAA family ATPase [Heyndrickxia sporothermodurans]|uniref:AAA family ATPase n=1 Tax=Heyndrickxia sporothermodurans TaxID=46224 RepID=A0AB37HJR3_9BACI|nr:AAA family ATPase [Heyndrickxia sporothermodurans]MBL5768230.1 AAA family ATPase [Heyndrickxia sporothermodurans]MBL5771009.1 AAA family ATPase [Heyndrickxia sporothermodurans]MBL5774695.1 AAA family ATPase [Heyndrickxia sporothermodurans]MBL5778111.1 AAA family ATPase [Heyndrickxia sporothermodurans]MBL5785384.1 AAA family ATPase [Heyndrickxia sporothermodurans]
MIITNVNEGKKARYSMKGTRLTIENQVSIDLEERQSDVQKVIDVCLDNQLQTMREGLGAWYVATIIIPPIQRLLAGTGEYDENDNEVMSEIELPLDMNKVELRLWGLPEEYGQEESIDEGVTE